MTDLSGCRAGRHQLKVIYIGHKDVVSEEVVRWCEVCGSIVIDVDFDGRTNAGQVMKMKAPQITKYAPTV